MRIFLESFMANPMKEKALKQAVEDILVQAKKKE